VLDPQIYTLFHVAVADNFVNDDTNSSWGDVVYNSGSAMVVFVWHALLFCCVGLDIDDITDMVRSQIGRKLDGSSLLETSLEHVARTRSVTERVRHLEDFLDVCLKKQYRNKLPFCPSMNHVYLMGRLRKLMLL